MERKNSYGRSWERVTKQIAIVIGMSMMLMFYQNCGGIQKPKASGESSVLSFNHKVLVNGETCTQCHEKDRKSPTHYAGQDCKSCHNSVSWANVGASTGHTITQNECASCHQKGGVQDSIATFKPDHFDFGTQDCLTCHQATKDNGFTDWRGGSTHNITMTTCVGCHGAGKVKDSIARFAPNHAAIGTQDCFQCHASTRDNGFVNWQGAVNQHSAAQNECSSCHGKGQSNDHIARFKPDHLAFGTRDCLECHQATKNNGFVDWTGWVYTHSSGDVTGKNCSICHDTAARPRPATGKRMEGTGGNTSHYGKYDCFFCHSTDRSFGDWNVGSNSSHKMATGADVQYCLPCHYNKAQGEHGGKTAWFQAPIYDINAIGNHPDKTGSLGNCNDCHSVQSGF